jgi:hypothetical protein
MSRTPWVHVSVAMLMDPLNPMGAAAVTGSPSET